MDYAQLTEPVNETAYNSLKPRSRGGVALYSLGNTKGSVIFMTLDTGTEVPERKFTSYLCQTSLFPILTLLLRKIRKHSESMQLSYTTVSSYQMSYHIKTSKTHIFSLTSQPSIVDNSFYPIEEHDSSNDGGESAIIEDSYNHGYVEEATEQQHIGDVRTEQEEIRGDSLQDATDNTTENPIEDTTSVTDKAVKPRVKLVREPYLMRERKPVRNVLMTNDNNQRDHIYYLSIKGVIKTHGNIAVKALFTEFSSLLGKSTFHAISKEILLELIRSSCSVKEGM